MTDVTGGFGDPRPDRALRRTMREQYAKILPMGETARGLLRPFATAWYVECVQCGRDLTDPGTTYYVERALRRDEPLFEFALCESCVYDFEDEFSQESIEAIGRFWLQRADFDDREDRIDLTENGDELVETCIVSGRPRRELDEFQVFAWCRDGQFVADGVTPGILSGEIIDELAEKLSRKTRESLDDFIRENLGLPPELHKLPVLI